MSYRDPKGRFIPRVIKAQDAIDRNLGENYKISDNYKGKPENAVVKLINDNPHWVGKFAPKNEPQYPKHPSHKPNFTTVDGKYNK